MRRFLLAAGLVTSLALPCFGAATATLPVRNFTISGGLVTGTGTLGGVLGTITSSMNKWSMTVDGATFATGTYSCNASGCSYVGMVIGSSTTFSFKTSMAGAVTSATGFPTHGAWVSIVAHWAHAHLSGAQIGGVVSDAARIEGLLASGDRQGGARGKR